jgi:hypothetical protein
VPVANSTSINPLGNAGTFALGTSIITALGWIVSLFAGSGWPFVWFRQS